VIAAVVGALDAKVPLDDPVALKAGIKGLFRWYKQTKTQEGAQASPRALELMASHLLNMDTVTRDLDWGNTFARPGAPAHPRLRPGTGKVLSLHPIILAGLQYWGEETTRQLMWPFLDAYYRHWVTFDEITRTLDALQADADLPAQLGPLGTIELRVVSPASMRLQLQLNNSVLTRSVTTPLWIGRMHTTPEAILPHRVIDQFIRRHNWGAGVVLIEDMGTGTKYLAKGYGVSDLFWGHLVDAVVAHDGAGVWTVLQHQQQLAPFILNGNKTHRYVPNSTLSIDVLEKLIVQVVKEHPRSAHITLSGDVSSAISRNFLTAGNTPKPKPGA
jgi:hypothetical protein